MADLVAIRAALAAQISANAVPFLTTSAEYLDTIDPPILLVIPKPPVSKFAITLGENILAPDGKNMSPTEFSISGMLVVSKGDTASNVQDSIDQWLGSQHTGGVVSVQQAVAMDPTLGGTVEWCITTLVDSYAPLDWAGIQYFGARFLWHVSAR